LLIGAGTVTALAVVVMLAAAAPAQAFKVKTNRGGSCTVTPFTQVQGDPVTYGINVPTCEARNGIQRIASEGFAIEGSQIVSVLPRKFGQAPYVNSRESNRTLPPTAPTPPLPVPIPPLPGIPDLPIDIPIIDDLPIIGGGGGGGGSGRTYTRIDFSLMLAANKGKRAKRKPERWRKRSGCARTSTKRNSDTLVCQAFAVTS
jgi:hypothetical protein